MSRTRTPRNSTDPRHRYHAVLEGTRKPETSFEIALDHLLHGTELSTESPVLAAVLDSVEAALASFDLKTARTMFDACLLGLGTPEELQAAFDVPVAETQAYAHLFFDRSVFQNGFHVMAYIASVEDEDVRSLLQSAHTRGFRELRFKYAAERETPAPDEIMSRVLEADARQYMRDRNIPLSDPRSKQVFALGKHVIDTAQVLAKTPVAKAQAEGAEGEEFVIQSGPLNPTLDELLSKGVEISY